jgi:uncharacterized protein YndB with AHSA1/START domain
MERYTIAADALIPAPAPRVYAILADYHEGHPSILPRPYFERLEVEQGGVGAGTEFVVEMNVLGRRQRFHGSISEPEPGRVIVERVRENGGVTTFTVEPRGERAHVTIAMELPQRGGLAGRVERWITTALFRRVLRRELRQLAAVAAAPAR